MDILVIGNGFDLAHELPTKYGEFLDFIKLFKRKIRKVKNWKNEEEFNKHQMDYIDNLFNTRENSEHSDNIIKELSELIENNKWIKYFLEIQEDMKKDGKEGWIDFESEISKIIKALDIILISLNEHKKINDLYRLPYYEGGVVGQMGLSISEYNSLEGVAELKKQLQYDLNRLIRCLEIYLGDFINKIADYKKMDLIQRLNIHKVLSFNYTDTFQRIYGVYNNNIEYHYIHGKANINHNKQNSNIVLGIDEYLTDNEKDNNIEFIQFKKFYQRIYKKTGNDYLKWLDMLCSNDNICFIGHSLDVTDKDILKKLITYKKENAGKAKVIVYYHNQEALSSQIANLVKVIGQDKLIELTGDEIIKFEQL